MSIITAASARSVQRGYDYYCNDKVISFSKQDETHYAGKVSGSAYKPYKVMIDLLHPKRSTCDCPFANGRKVCKHMVAVFFAAFPEEARKYKHQLEKEEEYGEEYGEEYREEYGEEWLERIEEHLRKLSKSELIDIAMTLLCYIPDEELEGFAYNYLGIDDIYDEDDYDEDECFEYESWSAEDDDDECEIEENDLPF